MNQQIIDAQDGLVRCIASGAPKDWVEFVGHFEIDPDCVDSLGAFLCNAGGHLVKVDAMEPGRRNYRLSDAIRALWKAMHHEWNSAIIRVDHTGRYRFALSDSLNRLADDANLKYNPTIDLVKAIIESFPEQDWSNP